MNNPSPNPLSLESALTRYQEALECLSGKEVVIFAFALLIKSELH